ncbi:MAG TPA: hypothetical protein VF865_12055 [Acidobacteriaceae bacterium]
MAVRIFRESPELSDDETIAKLVTYGFDPQLAARLVAFVPMAYFRIMLENSGAQFSDDFQQELPGGKVELRALTSEPLWGASLEFARNDAKSGISAQQFLAVAGRSAEADAANQALNAGHKLNDGMFGPCVVPWPEP